MKHKTLVTRYKNMGYTPLHSAEEQELDNIIAWMHATYNILIVVRPIIGMERRLTDKCLEKEGKKPLRDSKVFGWSIFDFASGLNIGSLQSSLGQDAFETPCEAKHEAAKKIFSHLKFRFN
jgi:hypothetical protein